MFSAVVYRWNPTAVRSWNESPDEVELVAVGHLLRLVARGPQAAPTPRGSGFRSRTGALGRERQEDRRAPGWTDRSAGTRSATRSCCGSEHPSGQKRELGQGRPWHPCRPWLQLVQRVQLAPAGPGGPPSSSWLRTAFASRSRVMVLFLMSSCLIVPFLMSALLIVPSLMSPLVMSLAAVAVAAPTTSTETTQARIVLPIWPSFRGAGPRWGTRSGPLGAASEISRPAVNPRGDTSPPSARKFAITSTAGADGGDSHPRLLASTLGHVTHIRRSTRAKPAQTAPLRREPSGPGHATTTPPAPDPPKPPRTGTAALPPCRWGPGSDMLRACGWQ